MTVCRHPLCDRPVDSIWCCGDCMRADRATRNELPPPHSRACEQREKLRQLDARRGTS